MILQFQIERKNKIENSSRTAWGRDNDKTEWEINFFSRYNEKEVYSYHCLSDSYRQCIPYEGNEHLLGTTEPYTEGGNK